MESINLPYSIDICTSLQKENSTFIRAEPSFAAVTFTVGDFT